MSLTFLSIQKVTFYSRRVEVEVDTPTPTSLARLVLRNKVAAKGVKANVAKTLRMLFDFLITEACKYQENWLGSSLGVYV